MSKRFDIVHPYDPDLGTLIILTNYAFWSNHEEELRDWCLNYCAWYQGMTVTITKDPDVMLFCLRWA